MTKPTMWVCTQPRLRSAWASVQSDQRLHCVLNGLLRTQPFFMRTSKTDQTGRMPRLICLRWAHTHFVGFVMRRLKYRCQNIQSFINIMGFRIIRDKNYGYPCSTIFGQPSTYNICLYSHTISSLYFNPQVYFIYIQVSSICSFSCYKL